MDLPTCPHCGESVLEDDVDECPFCGESMSGKPTAKKPAVAKAEPLASTPAEPKAEPPRQAKKKPPAKRPAEAKKATDGDEPFGLDQAAMTNAVPLRPKPTKGRTFKVVCPMCETPGYTSPKAAGRDVKCANPKCLVPVFTCPEPAPAPVAEEPESAGLSTTQLGLISVAALAVVGFGIWFFVLKKEDATDPLQNLNLGVGQNDDSSKTDDPEPRINPPIPNTRETPQGPDLVALRQEAAQKMIKTSEQPTERGIKRPKPLRVQLVALALADLGELEEAEAQLERLANFSDDSPHYRVLPWTEIGWKRRDREEDAGEAADKALEFAKDRAPSRQEVWRQSVALAGLLAALDRSDEALPLLERNLGDLEDQELWADESAVMLDHSFDLDALEKFRPVILPTNPAWSGVIWQLVFHDAAEDGLKWAQRAADEAVRTEAIVSWADAVASRALAMEKPGDFAALDAAIERLSEPWKTIAAARAYARIGQRYAIAEDRTNAETFLKKAEEARNSLPEKSPMPVPDLKAIYRGNFPRTKANPQMAAAAFEVARLQTALGKKDEAWGSVEKGLTILRSESLSLKDAKQLTADASDFLRSRLKSELSLNSDDEVLRALREYLKHVNELRDDAQARLVRQADLLSKAARWGLAERVYEEITEEPEGRSADAYFLPELELPWVVHAELKAAGSERVGELVSRIRAERLSKPKGLDLIERSAGLISSMSGVPKFTENLGKPTPALSDVSRKRWILRLASRQVLQGKTEEMLSFLLALFSTDPFLGEDAADLIVALAVKHGQGDAIMRELDRRSFSPTQKIAAYRGFIAAATPISPPPPSEPQTETQPPE